MNRRLLTILVCAFVVSTAVSYLVYRLVGNKMNSGGQPQLTALVVPTRNLEIGTLIKESDLKRADWTGELPKGAVVKKENAVGRGVVSALYEGEPIMENRLAPAGTGG